MADVHYRTRVEAWEVERPGGTCDVGREQGFASYPEPIHFVGGNCALGFSGLTTQAALNYRGGALVYNGDQDSIGRRQAASDDGPIGVLCSVPCT